jgi:hypothetical protein
MAAGLTWAQIRRHFLQIVGDNAAGREECWLHLAEGQRDCASRVKVPELQAIDESVTVPSEMDRIAVTAIDFDVFAILDGFNVTDGREVHPEPGGMTGRRRFLTTTGKPPSGPITHYQRDGGDIYVRNTPSVDTVLRFRIRRQMPSLSDANLNDYPLLPAEYHMAIVFGAAQNFYQTHPRKEVLDGVAIDYAEKYRVSKEEKLVAPAQSVVEEDRSRRETFRLRGYRLGPRSRR